MNERLHSNVVGPALDAQLFESIALTADGDAFDDADPSTWAAADSTEPEIVRLGAVRFRIIDPDAADLAVAADAIDGGEAVLAMRVAFEIVDGSLAPMTGQYLVLPTGEPNVSIMFRVWLTHADLHDPAEPDLGPDVQRNEALDVLLPGEALLVQTLENYAGQQGE